MARSETRRRRRLSRQARTSVRRTLWILGVPSSAKGARGLDAEEKALQTLQYHQRKKTEFPGGRRISAVRPSFHFSLEDKEGKDIIVEFQMGSPPFSEILPIQVQNWWSREAEEEFERRRICLVVIRPGDDKQRAREIVFEAISRRLAK